MTLGQGSLLDAVPPEPVTALPRTSSPAKICLVVDRSLDDPPGQWFLNEVGRHLPIERVGVLHTETMQPETVNATRWLILVGAGPLHRFRPDLTPGECHGRPMLLTGTFDGPILYPVWHYMSFHRNPTWRDLLTGELAQLVGWVHDHHNGRPWFADTPETCVHCRNEFYRCDAQGIVYCKRHWGRHGPR